MKKGVKYRYPYLTDVIFRIKFSNILQLSGNNKEAAESFRKKIFKSYPNVTIKKSHEFNIGIDINSGNPTEITQEGNLIWVFTNKEKNKQVELTATSLILHYKNNAYTHFRYFLEDIIILLTALKDYSPIDLKFLDLRYINQISGKSIKELEKCINSNYFSKNINRLNNNQKFVQTLTKFSIVEDGYLLDLQYGLFNPAYPNPEFDKDFILDFTCVSNNFNTINEIPDELKLMNNLIWKKFKDAITEKLENEMEEETND